MAYNSSFTGKNVDTAVYQILNYEEKVRYGNLIGNIEDQEDLKEALDSKVSKSDIYTDPTFKDDSDELVPSQKATKEYVLGTVEEGTKDLADKSLSNLSALGLAKITYVGGEGISIRNNIITNTKTAIPASTEEAGVLRVANPTDEKNEECIDASITPKNYFRLANYRLKNKQYNINDVVGCPYHNNIQLKCIVAGKTADMVLDTEGVIQIGQEIQDGTVKWVAEGIGEGTGEGLEIEVLGTIDIVIPGREVVYSQLDYIEVST